jgi:hypothetical protein
VVPEKPKKKKRGNRVKVDKVGHSRDDSDDEIDNEKKSVPG